MDADFWHEKWATGNIRFHQSQANPALVRHFEQLNLNPGDRIFLPLCGKTLDIDWLLSQGLQVAGAELSDVAIDQLFARLELEPTITPVGKLLHYSAEKLDIFVGDIFDLTAEILGSVQAIYDRAALVAMPAEPRQQYAAHLLKLTNTAPQLLITYEYDQSLMSGPPFSIPEQTVQQLYGAAYALQSLERREVDGRLKEQADAVESVWLLRNVSLA
ncbi:MAG: thiopurine S-methyltransferase [Cyanobacteria bacterium P01_H01_bin.121]